MAIKYIVHWRLDGENYSEEYNSLTEAELFRWKKIYQEGFTGSEVTIHLKQLNKFGDVIVVEGLEA